MEVVDSQLSCGKRHQRRPGLRFKDTAKCNMKRRDLDITQWQVLAQDRVEWQGKIRKQTAP